MLKIIKQSNFLCRSYNVFKNSRKMSNDTVLNFLITYGNQNPFLLFSKKISVVEIFAANELISVSSNRQMVQFDNAA